LVNAKDDIASLCDQYPFIAAPIVDYIDKNSFKSTVESGDSKWSAEFSFDQEVINTAVYREQMERVKAKRGKMKMLKFF
jgi:hypothetical protein